MTAAAPVLLASAGPRSLWYLTRSTGAVALVLLTLTLVLGVLDLSRWSSERWPRFAIDRIHRNVSLVAVVLIVLHVITSVVDGYAPISLVDAIIPLHSAYRPVWLGLGALSFDLMLAVVITSLLRRRMGHRAWRAVHWASYACWPLAVVHGIGTGTDAPVSWMLILTMVCVVAALAAAAWRVASGWPRERDRRVVAGAALAVAPIALVAWAATGPLAAGWARRAGTPASLLGASARRPVRSSSSTAPALSAPFSAQLSGSVSQRDVGDGSTVLADIPMTMSGGATGSLHVRLYGQQLGGGGISMTSSRVSAGPSAQPDLYTGRISELSGNRMVASVSHGSSSLRLDIDLNVDQAAGTVNGTVNATRGT